MSRAVAAGQRSRTIRATGRRRSPMPRCHRRAMGTNAEPPRSWNTTARTRRSPGTPTTSPGTVSAPKPIAPNAARAAPSSWLADRPETSRPSLSRPIPIVSAAVGVPWAPVPAPEAPPSPDVPAPPAPRTGPGDALRVDEPGGVGDADAPAVADGPAEAPG